MKTKKLLVLCFMIILAMLLLSGCVPGDGSNSPDKSAGFLSGVWHGWIAPFSLVYSLFNKTINIYEVYNKGFWYDLGYYMAIVSGFGSLSLVRRKKKQNASD